MQLSKPFLHAAQPQPLPMGTQVSWIKPLPIVGDGQTDSFRRSAEQDRHGRCLRMFHHILEAFLHDAEETGRLIERHRIRNTQNSEMDGQAGTPGNLLNMVFDRRAQPCMLQKRRMKPMRERVHIVRKGFQLLTECSHRSNKVSRSR